MTPDEIKHRFPLTYSLAQTPDGETITWGDPTISLDDALTAEQLNGAPTVDEARRIGVPVRVWDGD